MSNSGGNIKVVVRCRPLNARETARGAKALIRMEDGQTILDPPEASSVAGRAHERKQQVFSFDKSYWSAGARDAPGYASQQTLYEDLGVDLLDHSFEGFNTYGQTGSGKSYSMMGYGKDKGIIPLTTSELFRRVEERSEKDPNLSYSVEVSYMEIYNEKVRDLLNPKNRSNLKVREHPSLGPYVEDLSKLVVENYSQMMTLMDEGNKARTVASTNMNETSSRSHAVFTVILTQKRLDSTTKMTGEKVSKISLVDLAGSERQAASGATGTRLREGANINRSLTTLGKVIAALAQQSDHKGRKRKEDFVPYRDSVLTWLLKESLGGNSKTAMIAAISPADYEETLSTLRYADAAKRIKTHAVVNEDPNAKVIRELKEELEVLRSRVASGSLGGEGIYDSSIPPEQQIVTYRTKNGELRKVSKLELQDQLHASEKLMEGLNLTWEEKMAATQAIHLAREKALEDLGIAVDKDMVGVHAPQKYPSLVNLNEDPLMSECLVYQLKPGTTRAGSLDSPTAQIKLSGLHIMEEHCTITNTDGEVNVEAMPDARTFVNGKLVPPKTVVRLHHGYRVILGDLHVFRFNDPAGVRAHRTRLSTVGLSPGISSSADPGTPNRSDSPAIGELMDWTAARREVADIEALGDRDLDKLFDDIVKVRTLRGRPDSRLETASEVESRLGMAANPLPDEGVDENPWQNTRGWNGNDANITPNSDESTSRQGRMPDKVEALAQTPPRPSTPSSRRRSLPSSPSKQVDDPAFEHQTLKHLRLLSQEVKRIRSEAAVARARGLPAPDTACWSPKELVLARHAVDQWKSLRNFHMAEQLLLHAGAVREANVIAKQMGKRTTYNFAIMDAPIVSPKSALDDLGGIIEYEDVSDTSSATAGPRVMIKVIDHDSTCELTRGQTTRQPSVYTWNLQRFQQQLSRMRQVLQVKDKPNYSVHLSVDTPFGDTPSPSFSYIGGARVPLRLLAYQMSYAVIVPIYCAYTMEAIGSCRVEFKCSPLAARSSIPSATLDGPIAQVKPFGPKFVFTITVDAVKGLSEADFTEVHAQTRLSSLVGPDIASEDTMASQPVDLKKTSVSHLLLKRTLSVLATPTMESHFATGYATIEFFARVHGSYLEHLERFDYSKEVTSTVPSPDPEPAPTDSRPPLRRVDTEFTPVEHHDILASIEIQEMDSDGDYTPAEVEDDIFHLHQGVQRQLRVTLSHSSGQAFKWTKVIDASAGDIRVISKDSDSEVTVPAAEVTMQLLSHVEFASDGTARLIARGAWDTAAHHCIQLDRRTPNDDTLIVRVKLMIDVEAVDEPVVLTLDLRVRVIGRDARRSSLISFWRPRPFTNITALFGVDLAPPLARTARDLWRLDTAKKPVRNEIVLGDWRPRSIALVGEYAKVARVRRLLADVQCTRVILRFAGDIPITSNADSDEIVKQVVQLWQHELDTRVIFDVEQETPEEKEVAQRLRRLVPEIATRLVPTVKLITPESVVKTGTLALLKDSSQNTWEEMQAVMRPPYVHLFAEAGRRATQVINVAGANVEASPDVEMLLGRRYAFKVYTLTNSYIVQAASERELREWMTVIGRQR